MRRPAALGESHDFEHADRPVERDRHHVAGPHRAAWRVNAPAVDAHVTRGGEIRRRRARAHHPRVPKPFVDPLLVQAGRPSARLLGVRLELLLERGKLGERGIRIRVAIAAVPALASTLDVFRAQGWIAIRTIAAGRPLGALAALRALPTAPRLLRSRRARAARMTLGTIRPLLSLTPLRAVGTAARVRLRHGRSRGPS